MMCAYLTILLFSIYRVESVQHIHTLRPQLANINMLVSSIQYVEIIKPFVIERNMFRSFISCVYILHELFGVMVNVGPVTTSTGCSSLNTSQELLSTVLRHLFLSEQQTDSFWRSAILNIRAMILPVYMHPCSVMCGH